MPCRSDYMEATEKEKERDRLCALLEELEHGTQPNPRTFGSGYGYSQVSTKHVEVLTPTLCETLKEIEEKGDIGAYSLEMQTWWRNHKEGDKRRRREEEKEEEERQQVEAVLAKLSRQEKRLLKRFYERG